MKDVDTRWGAREAKGEQKCEEDELKTLVSDGQRGGSVHNESRRIWSKGDCTRTENMTTKNILLINKEASKSIWRWRQWHRTEVILRKKSLNIYISSWKSPQREKKSQSRDKDQNSLNPESETRIRDLEARLENDGWECIQSGSRHKLRTRKCAKMGMERRDLESQEDWLKPKQDTQSTSLERQEESNRHLGNLRLKDERNYKNNKSIQYRY